jgi:alpha-tubulin suppressor-like RCC1 family protein
MYIPRQILGQFGAQLSFARGWRAPLLLALTAVTLGCEGSSPNGVVGPNEAVKPTVDHLAFTVQPNATTATAAIFPAVQVTAMDASGNTVTGFTGKVTMAIGTNPTGGVLQGTTGVSAVNGVATFSNLIISKAGTGYTLTATSGKLPPVTSVAFNVALPATQLIFSVQPSTTSQGATISPAVQVTALDKNGHLAEGYRQNVTVAIGTNPNAGTLAGTMTVTFVHGVATFSDLSIDKVGSGYTLRATSLKLAATSAAFDITSAVTPFVSVSVGNRGSCGLTAAGKAYCWGDNTYGQVGDGTNIDRRVPTAVSGNLTFSSISAGDSKACGVTTAGQAYCWGNGDVGALGNGTTSSSNVPVQVSGGLTFASVSATGQFFACGVTTSGAGYCWGYGAFYTLGTGNNSSSSTPVAVAGGHTFSAISAGRQHGCGVTPSGDGYCWGQNDVGQIGNGGTSTAQSPSLVTGAHSFSVINAGDAFTCGVTTAGAGYCWGTDNQGQLGNGVTTDPGVPTPTPAAVSGSLTFNSITAGGIHACGTVTGGAAYCWGAGGNGQLGNGTFTSVQNTPVVVSGGFSFVSLSAGRSHVCGVTTGEETYCWGTNNSGELGIGTNASVSNVPVAVMLP